MDTLKRDRYIVSGIASFLISVFMLLLAEHVNQVEPEYSIGLYFLVFSFIFKAVADIFYAFNENIRKHFHFLTFLHYLLAGIILVIFRYFGLAVSLFFATLLLLFAYYELKHTLVLENEVYRVKRHIVATVFRWMMGSFIFFDSLFYNYVNPTLFGWVITIFGTLSGIYILYSALLTYRYIQQSSKIPIAKALTTF